MTVVIPNPGLREPLTGHSKGFMAIDRETVFMYSIHAGRSHAINQSPLSPALPSDGWTYALMAAPHLVVAVT